MIKIPIQLLVNGFYVPLKLYANVKIERTKRSGAHRRRVAIY